MWHLGGHLGSSVSALVDGQLDAETAERAWAHVLRCPPCRRMVEREGRVKRQLVAMAGNEPSARLLGSLYELDARPSWEGLEAWVAVDELERKGRTRRRAGLALVGAGSVSAAVFGFATLGGASLGIGGAPSGTPVSSLTRATAASTRAGTPADTPTRAAVARADSVRGRAPRSSASQRGAGVERSVVLLNRR